MAVCFVEVCGQRANSTMLKKEQIARRKPSFDMNDQMDALRGGQ